MKNPQSFEMVFDGENSMSIKRIYPESLSLEEKEKAENSTPEVILRCFNHADIKELQELAEKLVKQHYATFNGNGKAKKIAD